MTENVVDFTKVREEKIYNDLMKQIEENFDRIFADAIDIDQLAFLAIGSLVEEFMNQGYNVNDNPETAKDIMLLLYATKGLLYRCKGEKSTHQGAADQLYQHIEDPQEILDRFMSIYYNE